MSDLRIPYRWLADRRMNRLSDSAFRSYVNAFGWSVEQRTDGLITRDDFTLIPRFQEKHLDEIVKAELWRPLDVDSWQIVEYEATQTSRADFEVLDHARKSSREKKQRQRARDKAVSPGTVPGMFEGTAQERKGQARQGQESTAVTWNVVQIPETWVDPATGEIEELI
jgi:hypothetical protein